MSYQMPASLSVLNPKAGHNNEPKQPMTDELKLKVEELEERIAPSTVGALHNNPDNPNNNNNHNAVPKGAIPEGPAGN